jgi:hypothetical protein
MSGLEGSAAMPVRDTTWLEHRYRKNLNRDHAWIYCLLCCYNGHMVMRCCPPPPMLPNVGMCPLVGASRQRV